MFYKAIMPEAVLAPLRLDLHQQIDKNHDMTYVNYMTIQLGVKPQKSAQSCSQQSAQQLESGTIAQRIEAGRSPR